MNQLFGLQHRSVRHLVSTYRFINATNYYNRKYPNAGEYPEEYAGGVGDWWKDVESEVPEHQPRNAP